MDQAEQPVASRGGEVPFGFGGAFARAFASSASAVLGVGLQVRTCETAQRRLSEFLAALADGSCRYVLATTARRGTSRAGRGRPAVAAVSFSPEIAFAIVDRLLGASGPAANVPSRAPTEVDRRVLRSVAAAAAEALSTVWPAADAPGFAVAPGAFGPEALLPDGTDGPVVVVSAAVALGRHVGAVRLGIPGSIAAADADRRQPPAASGPLELAVCLPAEIGADELAQLAPGDVLITDSPADGEVVVRLAGIPKYAARLGSADGKRAVRITRKL